MILGEDGTPKSFEANNNTTLFVNGTLIIWGDLIVNNNLILVVNGSMVVKGDIDIKNNGTFNVEGTLEVEGNFTAGNNVNVNVDGSINVENTVTVGANAVLTGSGTFTAGNCNPPASDFCGGVLPVELLFFNAKNINGIVELSWATASETGFDHFEIQRSLNIEDFKAVDFVSGKGTSLEGANYEAIDYNPFVGRSYYRLKAVDLDGSFEYFGMVRVDNDANKRVAVYPNPLQQQLLNVDANFLPEEDAKIVIFNNTGKIVLQTQAASTSNKIDLKSELKPGIYIVRFITNQESFSSRLIVH